MGVKEVPTIGLRAETMHKYERRVALTPAAVKSLVSDHRIRVVVQRSPIRIFPAQAFREAGAEIVTELGPNIPVVLGVKQVPADFFQPGNAYIFFSHVHKGQKENMHMLRCMMERGSTLIDHERIVDAQNRRLVAFGYYAGVAGMTDTLHVLGQRLVHLGLKDNPFAAIKQTLWYEDGIREITGQLKEIGESIRRTGLPAGMDPFVIGFTGSAGRVASGATEIYNALCPKTLTPQQLLEGGLGSLSRHEVYKVMFKRSDRVKPREDGIVYSSEHFAAHPEEYMSAMLPYLSFMTAFVHCAYWEPTQPRVISNDDLLALGTNPRLKVIGDISCDIEGGVEATVRGTTPEDPFFTFNPLTGKAPSKWFGDGVVVNALETSPCELPLDASNHFSRVLLPFIPGIVTADLTADYQSGVLSLPEPIRPAVILWKGKLTPSYDAISKIHDGLSRFGNWPNDVNH